MAASSHEGRGGRRVADLRGMASGVFTVITYITYAVEGRPHRSTILKGGLFLTFAGKSAPMLPQTPPFRMARQNVHRHGWCLLGCKLFKIISDLGADISVIGPLLDEARRDRRERLLGALPVL